MNASRRVVTSSLTDHGWSSLWTVRLEDVCFLSRVDPRLTAVRCLLVRSEKKGQEGEG